MAKRPMPKSKARDWYGDVEVTLHQRVRVSCRSDGKMTPTKMLAILKNEEYDDITEEEAIEYISVERVDGEYQE